MTSSTHTAARVVDTNVAVAANGASDAGAACVVACARALARVQKLGPVVLDDGWRILREYQRHLRSQGQPGPGDAFLKWLLTNLRNPLRCVQVHLTAGPDSESFAEFPAHPQLLSFDPADRKFVAVAAAHPARPAILQATDSRWWGWRNALAEAGITVEFLCRNEVAARFEQRQNVP